MAADGSASYADLNANVEEQMQADIDDQAFTAGMPIIPPPTAMPRFDAAAMQQMMHNHFQQMMQQMMSTMAASFSAPGATGSSPGGIQSAPGGNIGERLANVRLDERAFRRIDRFSNKREDWREWRTHLLTAVRECDKSFADQLVAYEKSEAVIEDTALNPTLQQLSATLQARLIALTSKEAFSIVTACEGQGIEAWRQLVKRYDPQTDARFANLVNDLIGFRITKGQDVQTEMVKWEAMLLSMDRDHGEKFSPKMRRCLLLSIVPKALRDRLLEHLDRLVDYAQLREKIVSLVQVAPGSSPTDASNIEEQEEEGASEEYSQEEEAMDLAALSEVVCHRCNKKGHFARNCKVPSSKGSRKGGGKGGTRFMQSYGKGGSTSNLCPGCNKPGHTSDKCWKLHPELVPPKFKKKVQGVEDEEIKPLGMITLSSIELKDTSCSTSSSTSADLPVFQSNESLDKEKKLNQGKCQHQKFLKEFPILTNIRNKYELLEEDEEDNDNGDPDTIHDNGNGEPEIGFPHGSV